MIVEVAHFLLDSSHETYWSVTTDINHIGAELTWGAIEEILTGLILFPVVRNALKWYANKAIQEHDKEYGHDHEKS